MADGKRPSGFVYFIQAGQDGPVKIGYSEQPEQRLRDLQSSNHEPLYLLVEIPGDLELERAYHTRFHEGRVQREWFGQQTPGLQEEIHRLMGLCIETESFGWCEWCWQRPQDPGRLKFCSDECSRARAKQRSRDLRRRQRKAKVESMESERYRPDDLQEGAICR